nr:uncharacterized protein LOC129382776 [Dermacentor andersoni]
MRKNPPILGVRRLGKGTKAVLILFEESTVPRQVYRSPTPTRCVLYKKKYEVCYACGRLGPRSDVCPNPDNKKCRRCGEENPQEDHQCEAKCQLCGKEYPLGDKRCKELYRTPYEIKKKIWEKKKDKQEELKTQQRQPPADGAEKLLKEDFPKLGGNNQGNLLTPGSQETRGHRRSRSRDPKDPWGKGRSRSRDPSREPKQVSFVEGSSQAKDDKDREIEQLKKKVEELQGLINNLMKAQKEKEKATSPPPRTLPAQPKQVAQQTTPPIPKQREMEGEKMNESETVRRPPLKRKGDNEKQICGQN